MNEPDTRARAMMEQIQGNSLAAYITRQIKEELDKRRKSHTRLRLRVKLQLLRRRKRKYKSY